MPDSPIVAGMVPRPSELAGPNVTGVYLEIPCETQFLWLRRFLPNAAGVGILYRSGENEETLMAALKVAESMKLHLEARRVNSLDALDQALGSLKGRTDTILSIYEPSLMTPDCARRILLFGAQAGIPVVGLSSAWVKAGALYCLECDYVDLGDQCGAMAVQILRGSAPQSIPPAPPRKISYSINQSVGDRLSIHLSDALVGGAHQTFD